MITETLSKSAGWTFTYFREIAFSHKDTPMQLNHARLLNSLTRLAQFGKIETVVNRLSFTPEDRAARQWL